MIRVSEPRSRQFPIARLSAIRNRPGSRLGQVRDAREIALRELSRSARAAEAEIQSLVSATPTNWEARLENATRIGEAEMRILKSSVIGKTADLDAEDRVFSLWGDILEKSFWMRVNKPSIVQKLFSGFAQFWKDFWAPTLAAYQNLVQWGVSKAGPILEDWYKAENNIRMVMTDLAEAKASGDFSQEQIRIQEEAINRARLTMDGARDTFKFVTMGLSLDDIAQAKYGPYTSLGVALVAVPWISIGIAIAVIASAIIVALSIGTLVRKAPEKAALLVGGVAAGLVAVYLIFK